MANTNHEAPLCSIHGSAVRTASTQSFTAEEVLEESNQV